MTPPSSEILRSLSSAFLDRAKAMRWSAKQADAKALEFFLGAWMALAAINHPSASTIGNFTSMVISVRGTAELKRLVKETSK